MGRWEDGKMDCMIDLADCGGLWWIWRIVVDSARFGGLWNEDWELWIDLQIYAIAHSAKFGELRIKDEGWWIRSLASWGRCLLFVCCWALAVGVGCLAIAIGRCGGCAQATGICCRWCLYLRQTGPPHRSIHQTLRTFFSLVLCNYRRRMWIMS